ncbi:MAG: hypothetical protein KDD50_08580, partial [Bdellovibrionales bacterium]|nr:hypothetical protein [Bdellovibrionales bacterium]
VKEKEKYLAEILELNEAIKRKDKKLVEEIHSFNALEREKKTLEEALAKNIDSKKNNFELMKKFNIKLEKYDFQIQELLKESKRKDQTYLELKSEFEENVTQLNGLKADYSRLHESKVDSERLIHKIKELEFERKDSIKTNQIQRDEIVKLSELIDKLKIELDDQKTVISNQSVRIKAKENWINPLKQEEQLQDLLKAKDIEIERVRISSLQDKNKMINDYSEKEERYQREIHQLKLQIHRDDSVVEKELEQYKNLLKIQSTEVERWREVHSQLKKENEQKDKQLEAILEKSSTKIKQLEESNQKMIDELKVIAEARTLEKESVSERERQLNYYAQSLDSEREKVRSKIDQFLNEMRASMSLNPLKNYLFVTEKEISKIQKALGKIPFGASNREPMEVGLEKLIDQRDELKNMIYESESIYQSKIKEFRQILNSGAFSDIPPLPPIV